MTSLKDSNAPGQRGAEDTSKTTSKPNYSKPATNSAGHQRLSILLFLQTSGPLTTLAARQELGVCHLAARVMELRNLGHNIITYWRVDHDSAGVAHRVAEYVLLPGKYQEVA